MVPLILVLDFFNINDDDIGGIDVENHSFWGLFFVAVVFAPIIETLIGQALPIKLVKKLLKNKFKIVPLFLSAIIFSLMHFGYSVWYSILVFPMAILLAQTYIIFEKRKESSFWMTTAVHAFRNLIGVIVIFIDLE